MPRQVGAGNSHFPCPNGNGTQIGDVEKFNVLCGLDIGGVEIDRMQVDSLGTCVSICTSYQGTRCDGVTFRLDNVCIFKTAFMGAQFQKTTNADSAIGILPNPPPSSRCDSLGTGAIQLVTSKNFNLQCGQVFAGNDIEQQFQPTFDACLNACAAMTACGGVSYDVQQSQGFKNCFLKTTVTTGGLLSKAGIDSAFMTVDNSVPMVVSQPSSSVLQATPSVAQLSPANTPDTASLNDPSSQSTRILTSSSTILPLSETTSSSIPSLGLATSTAVSSMATTSSNAWIAAPVIGSIAAVALLIGFYVLWIRRRRQNHGLPISFIDRFRGGGIHRAPSFTGGAKFDDEAAVRSLSVSSSNSHNDILVTRVVSRDMDSPSRSRPGTGDGEARFLAPLELLPLEDVVVDKTNSVLRNSQNGLKLNGVSVRSTDKEPLSVTSKERDDTKPSDSETSDRTSQ
ncbi:hypothetical protein PFICI_05470 [Pestalotiopsis fici W106-1]|uniref:Apple domain-containing protein n=1 Tax=Pestalotiopsis fici (strain W106-1 / CGMCC3.15140) TaxID=1229662 RepID=W3XC41_PESFW|nr:uncharacterized protein PFICI_05470 [Pestalotiopsis fici W106-1]ETS83594.1 hypothetical protein PFICI_05470 [Pestalotiopsis fici W106-1]